MAHSESQRVSTTKALCHKAGITYVGGVELVNSPPDEDENALVPVARWNTVPYQRITSAFTAGVVAFCKKADGDYSDGSGGIWGVGFSVNSGAETYVQTMAHNERLDATVNGEVRPDIWDYFIEIDPADDDFDDGDVITLDATVYSLDGGQNELPQLTLTVDSSGEHEVVEAWVDGVGGGTPAVGSSGTPFATIHDAGEAIQAYRLANYTKDNADGGIIYLKPGDHAISASWGVDAIDCDNEWLTIRSDPNSDPVGTIANTAVVVEPSLITMWIYKVRFHDITLQNNGTSTQTGYINTSLSDAYYWCDAVKTIGVHHAFTNRAHGTPFSTNWGRSFVTDSYVTTHNYSVLNVALARNTISHACCEDSFMNCWAVVGCKVVDSVVDEGAAHIDAWQFNANNQDLWEDIIVYGFHVADRHFQGVDCDLYSTQTQVAERMAFVNFYIEKTDSIQTGHNGNFHIKRSVNHLLIWNFTSRYDGVVNDGGAMMIDYNSYSNPAVYTHLDIRNSALQEVHCREESTVTMTAPLVDNCNFRVAGGSARDQLEVAATNSGVAVDPEYQANGMPVADGPLHNKVTYPLVPVDVLGVERATGENASCRGAIEYVAP